MRCVARHVRAVAALPTHPGKEALAGIVQAMLITKHIMFVGFSLRDEAFNEIAATVRRSLKVSTHASKK